MRLKLLLLLFIIIGIAVPPSIGQGDIVDIELGTVEGTITDSFFTQRYRFQGEAGKTYDIRLARTSGSLDPQLFLFDGTEQFITDNDDSSEGSRDSEIVFTPNSDAPFIIEATRFQREDGTSTGSYRLVLAVAGEEATTPIDTNPLNLPPDFGVEDFAFLEYETVTSGEIDAENPRQYFVLAGNQGDAVQITITAPTGERTSGSSLLPDVSIVHPDFIVPSLITRSEPDEQVIYAVFPQSSWYLIEASHETATGSFSLFASLVHEGLLTEEAPVDTRFSPDLPAQFFVMNATINERLFINMTILVEEGGSTEGIVPQLTVLDRSGATLIQRESQGTQTRVTLTIPRSGPYIIRADNLGIRTDIQFRLEMRRSEPNISKLRILPAEYNENYTGTIDDDNPIDYYRFSGKAGELVTVEMRPSEASEMQLDPFLILARGDLNELVFNDNAGATSGARIAQYALPDDGDYFILATRPGLSLGSGDGDYEMSITVGQIALRTGVFTATVEWSGTADLNLFVRAPSGRIVSWANPTIPDGGALQIDSNTACETPTAQPVEHIFWPGALLAPGDYTIWVWYQNVCSNRDPVPFTLTLAGNGRTILRVGGTPEDPLMLAPQARFEVSIRIGENGSSTIVDPGTITTPSAQQSASQGGDTLLAYGQSATGTISDAVFAQFYQFRGVAGDRVRIRVERITGDLDPIVVLRDSLDHNLAQNDDANGTRNSELTFTLPEDGRYVIGVTRFGLRDGTTKGDYRVTLERNTS